MIFVRNLRLRPNAIAEPGENFYWRRRVDGRLRFRSVDEEGNRVSRSPQEVAGASMQDVVKITTSLTNVANYPAFNKAPAPSPTAPNLMENRGEISPSLVLQIL